MAPDAVPLRSSQQPSGGASHGLIKNSGLVNHANRRGQALAMAAAGQQAPEGPIGGTSRDCVATDVFPAKRERSD
jgi:hypothetical protein